MRGTRLNISEASAFDPRLTLTRGLLPTYCRHFLTVQTPAYRALFGEKPRRVITSALRPMFEPKLDAIMRKQDTA
jgi:hypothetical protein